MTKDELAKLLDLSQADLREIRELRTVRPQMKAAYSALCDLCELEPLRRLRPDEYKLAYGLRRVLGYTIEWIHQGGRLEEEVAPIFRNPQQDPDYCP